MEIEEYLEIYNEIIQKHRDDKIQLDETFRNNIDKLGKRFSENYVKKFAKFQIGDFIKYYITIKIEKIKTKIYFGKPTIYYYGYKHVLDKSGKIVKYENSKMYCFGDNQNLIKVK